MASPCTTGPAVLGLRTGMVKRLVDHFGDQPINGAPSEVAAVVAEWLCWPGVQDLLARHVAERIETSPASLAPGTVGGGGGDAPGMAAPAPAPVPADERAWAGPFGELTAERAVGDAGGWGA